MQCWLGDSSANKDERKAKIRNKAFRSQYSMAVWFIDSKLSFRDRFGGSRSLRGGLRACLFLWLWFPLKLYDGGPGLRLNDDYALNL